MYQGKILTKTITFRMNSNFRTENALVRSSNEDEVSSTCFTCLEHRRQIGSRRRGGGALERAGKSHYTMLATLLRRQEAILPYLRRSSIRHLGSRVVVVDLRLVHRPRPRPRPHRPFSLLV